MMDWSNVIMQGYAIFMMVVGLVLVYLVVRMILIELSLAHGNKRIKQLFARAEEEGVSLYISQADYE